MSSIAECKDFEILFSKQDAILSFSCEDLAFRPGHLRAMNWLPNGWAAEFDNEGQPCCVHFPGAPEDVLSRVAAHGKLLVVGLRKGADPYTPQIEISQEIQLPGR